jgi:hypothetical protein
MVARMMAKIDLLFGEIQKGRVLNLRRKVSMKAFIVTVDWSNA